VDSLDRSENATLGADEQRTTSQNMDDTGFFSISVLEKVRSRGGVVMGTLILARIGVAGV
jgi:hypothetical protein